MVSFPISLEASIRILELLIDTYNNNSKIIGRKSNYILRPHPTEIENDWIKIIGNYKNLVITKSHSSTYWVRRSKIMIHNLVAKAEFSSSPGQETTHNLVENKIY